MMTRPLPLVLLLGTGLLTACPGDDGVQQPTSDDSTSSDGSTGPVTPPTTTGPDPDSTTTGDESTSTGSTSIDPDSTTGSDACGNGMVDAEEICDGSELAGETCMSQGFDAGQLACADDCSAYDTSSCSTFNCGNDTIENREVCDGTDLGGVSCQSEGFDNGTVTCANDCASYDISECGLCGNVIVDGSEEVCDSVALLGQSCLTQGFDNGLLGCTADCLAYDTSTCGTCGNVTIDGAEACDDTELNAQTCLTQGFDSGTLACATDCLTFETEGCGVCGNAVTDGDEFCDMTDVGGQTCLTQGFDSGTLGCAADCAAYDTSTCGVCGNGALDGSESCDGLLLGGETCAGIGLGGGTLACTAGCQFDFSGCDIAGFPFGSDGFYDGFSLTPGMLPCDDISATGVATGLLDDDELGVPMGFTFTFYGVPFTQATIASNGAVYFNSIDYLDYINACMPGDTFSPVTDYLFAPFWTDLDPSSAGEVRYQTLGVAPNQRFVVQWDVPFYGGDIFDLVRVQAVFHQSGNIEVCYPDTISAADFGNSGADATSGIQLNPLTGFQYSCDMASLTNGLMLMYLPV